MRLINGERLYVRDITKSCKLKIFDDINTYSTQKQTEILTWLTGISSAKNDRMTSLFKLSFKIYSLHVSKYVASAHF